jgi:hypothetical protein
MFTGGKVMKQETGERGSDELLMQASDALYEARVDVTDGVGLPESVGVLLEAAGTLVAMGGPIGFNRFRGRMLSLHAKAYLVDLDFSFLEVAAEQIAADAAGLYYADEEELPERAQSIREALAARDTLELKIMGAEEICREWEMDDEQRSSLIFFEDTVSHELWHLLSLGESLWIELAWMAPAKRQRFWWRHRAYGFTRKSLDALIETASTLAAFPEAQDHFDALLKTARVAPSEAEKFRDFESEFMTKLGNAIKLFSPTEIDPKTEVDPKDYTTLEWKALMDARHPGTKATIAYAADKAADEAENAKQAVEGYMESMGED